MRSFYKKKFPKVKLGFIQLLLETDYQWVLDLSLDPRYGLKQPREAEHDWFVICAKKLAFLGEKTVRYMLQVSNQRIFDIIVCVPYRDTKKVIFQKK